MTQESDLDASVRFGGETGGGAPSKGGGGLFPSPQRAPVSAKESLRQPYKQPGGQVEGERASHAEASQAHEHPRGSGPSSANVINGCARVSCSHPTAQFLHVWKATESKLGM